jgi:hypothetical protein
VCRGWLRAVLGPDGVSQLSLYIIVKGNAKTNVRSRLSTKTAVHRKFTILPEFQTIISCVKIVMSL